MPCSLARGSGRGTRQQSFLAEAEGAELGHSASGWLGADGCPSPAKTSVVPSVGQHLHGAQSRQLHKGVCSDFVDPVVLETTGKTETGLRKELKAAVTFVGSFVPRQQTHGAGGIRYSSLGDLLLFEGVKSG